MKRVLILGAKGMLGDAVHRYFKTNVQYEVLTCSERWPGTAFKTAVIAANADYIVNCIGKIPQRHPTDDEYRETNIELPVFLETIGVPVIHPSTDCEFSGRLPYPERYTKSSVRDAEDDYGKSKAAISEKIEASFRNTKILRTSIIGHEQGSSVSLLDWFLASEGSVKGYTNHYWNGITTLEWAKQARDLMEAWDTFPVLNQLGTEEATSKYEVLKAIANVYGKSIDIEPFAHADDVNKCLFSDTRLPSLNEQLTDLSALYQK